MTETLRMTTLPRVSARGSLLLAGAGLASLMLGLLAGAALLVPAGIAALCGLFAGLTRELLVLKGRAWPCEGETTLIAATFVNGSLTVFTGMAAFIVLRFGA